MSQQDDANYEAWLASPFGQVHVKAAEAEKMRPIREAQATLEHFAKHTECREGVNVASRCVPGWWDRDRCGPMNEIIQYAFNQSVRMHISAWQDWLFFIKASQYEYVRDSWRPRRKPPRKKSA
ncbi:hypothetical protein G4Y79_20820 [Phototrophicus methaneseepsis]|uniref:Uncharacterized protein n=1 Tax=Phototrophicus methaneseepsis TaxID=2710758 RepID=A0A7S8E857_9CHLR|nr:hypothetical protein [Phototrophicus methaneseepsis]QPC82100.1 hypothetical protein G4Y79_20820 [Phototrophicus methaneseepsis]